MSVPQPFRGMRSCMYMSLLGLLMLSLLFTPIAAAQETTIIHVVRPGENLYLIADRYGVTIRDIMLANRLRNPNVIYVGQELKIPVKEGEVPPATPAPEFELRTHIVRPGETLYFIALRYNVTVGELMRANNLRNPHLIYVGQKLVIPGVPAPTAVPPAAAQPTPSPTSTPTPTIEATPVVTATPAVEPTATPTPTPSLRPAAPTTGPIAAPPAGPCACDEVIVISSPAQNQTVVSPVVVTGFASAFEQQVTVRILDEAGNEVGLGVGFIDADLGERGPFTATVPFIVPLTTQFGRIQVYTVSPRDGAVEHLNSVTVRLQGLDLDPMVELLKEAIESKNYDDLRNFMPPDGFSIVQYQSEGQVLTPDEAIQQLKEEYLGPGDVTVDPSVDAQSLLEGRVTFPADVRLVVYSTGWGPEGDADAFLVIVEREGRAFWGGLLYVPADMIDYR